MMKKILCLLLGAALVACAPDRRPVSLIFDTDMGPDYDDVGAMAVLHALADSGEVDILATVSSNRLETTVPCIDVLNTYFGRPDIPLGAPKGEAVCQDTWHAGERWTAELPARFPHRTRSASEAEDAVTVYRRVLAASPDTSVTVVTVGFFTNLRNLLESAPDEFSPLSGRDLAAAKVRRLVSMAGHFPEGLEFNVMMDAPAAAYVMEHWPTEIVLSGFEIGDKIITGRRTAAMDVEGNPVREAYAMSLAQDDPAGRNSWDQSAVLVAVRGAEPYFDLERGRLSVDPSDSTDRWRVDPDGPHARLVFREAPERIADRIESLMMHLPQGK